MPKYKDSALLNTGITIMEVLIVIGLLSVIASFGLFTGMDDYTRSSFRDERDLFVSMLMHARAQAMNALCIDTPSRPCDGGREHGVHVEKENGKVVAYVLFQGGSYDEHDEANERVATHSPLNSDGPAEVSFKQVRGDVESPISITFAGPEHEESEVRIGIEGQINWTH